MTTAPRALIAHAWGRVERFAIGHWSIITVILVAVAYMATVTLLHDQTMSERDEWGFLDYIAKVYSQGIVHEGETYGQAALQQMACHGIIPHGVLGAACASGQLDPALFPYQGVNSAAAYPPFQFWFTRVAGDAIALLPGVSPLAGYRLVGILWLSGGLIVLYRLARALRLGHGPFLAVALAFVASPLAYWSFSYVSTDAASWFFGALILLLGVRLTQGRGRAWPLIVIAVIATLVKVTAILALGLVLVYLVVRYIIRRRSGRPAAAALIWGPAIALAAALAAQIAWMRLQPLLRVSDTGVDQGISYGLTPPALLQQFSNFLQHTMGTGIDVSVAQTYLYLPLGWIPIVGVVGSIFLLRRGSRDVALTIAVAIAAVLAAPVMAVVFQLVTGSYFSIPPRYGIVILPGMLLMAMQLIRNRTTVWIVSGYALVVMVYGISLSAELARLYP
ncbi:MAG TPA: hypothetical protein VNQ52_00655 [Microbacteriaceae bacterium]|nr:hypothetical protein [Microbacteriaceae bacterium]